MNALCPCSIASPSYRIHSGGRGLGAVSLDIGCPQYWTDSAGAVHAFTQAQIDLCQARSAMQSQPGSFGGDAWAMLHSLENEAGYLTNAMTNHIGLALNPGDFLAQLIDGFWNRVTAFLNWLKSILGEGLFILLALAAGAMVLYSALHGGKKEKA